MGGGKDRCGHRNDGLFRSAPGSESYELGAEIVVLVAGGRPRALHQHGFEPRGAMAQAARHDLASTLVEFRTQPGPGPQVSNLRKPAHIDADLCNDHVRGRRADSRNSYQVLDRGAKGLDRSLYPRLERRDRLLQVLNHSEMLAEQEPVMGRDLALQRRRQGFARSGQPPVAQSRQRRASVWPALIALSIRRPLSPNTSDTTEANFTLASSSTFWIRCLCCTISRISCLRVRVRSRNSWIGPGGTKLARISPCAKRSAIQVASLTSLLRPGTLRICAGLARISSNSPSSTCHTGFQ